MFDMMGLQEREQPAHDRKLKSLEVPYATQRSGTDEKDQDLYW
jgi:hypothetical protein